MLLPFVSCSPKVYPTETKDSVRVEIRDRVIHDSVYFEVERQVEKIVTRDTVSLLENDWARSEASVDSAGLLHHSLESIPRKVYVPYYVEVHDTTTVEGHTETIVQEVNRLTHLQLMWMRLGKVLSALVVAVMLSVLAMAYMKSKGL